MPGNLKLSHHDPVTSAAQRTSSYEPIHVGADDVETAHTKRELDAFFADDEDNDEDEEKNSAIDTKREARNNPRSLVSLCTDKTIGEIANLAIIAFLALFLVIILSRRFSSAYSPTKGFSNGDGLHSPSEDGNILQSSMSPTASPTSIPQEGKVDNEDNFIPSQSPVSFSTPYPTIHPTIRPTIFVESSSPDDKNHSSGIIINGTYPVGVQHDIGLRYIEESIPGCWKICYQEPFYRYSPEATVLSTACTGQWLFMGMMNKNSYSIGDMYKVGAFGERKAIFDFGEGDRIANITKNSNRSACNGIDQKIEGIINNGVYWYPLKINLDNGSYRPFSIGFSLKESIDIPLSSSDCDVSGSISKNCEDQLNFYLGYNSFSTGSGSCNLFKSDEKEFGNDYFKVLMTSTC